MTVAERRHEPAASSSEDRKESFLLPQVSLILNAALEFLCDNRVERGVVNFGELVVNVGGMLRSVQWRQNCRSYGQTDAAQAEGEAFAQKCQCDVS